MGKLKVGVDLDDTLYFFIAPLLERYNFAYNDNVKFEDITDYHIHNFLSPHCENIFREFADKEFFNQIYIEKEVIDELTKLNDKYQLYFVTAGAAITIRDRDKLLSRNLNWYKTEQLIVCRDKHLLKFDYLIDDYQGNLSGMNDYTGILIDKPWNQNNSTFIRSNGFVGVSDIIERIEDNHIPQNCVNGEWWGD